MFNDRLGIYPDRGTYAASDVARCIMFYDWEKPVGPDWLELAKIIFAEFGQEIVEGIGNLGKRHSHGRFGTVEKKLLAFLEAARDDAKSTVDIQVRSGPYIESDAFYPCDVEIAWSISDKGQKDGLIAVRRARVDSCDSLVERIGKKLFSATGAAYAGAFDFPTLFGPGYYQVGLGTMPAGVSSLANEKYTARITRWRDARWRGLLTSTGYVREIYPINFLLESHLCMRFEGRPLSEYLEKVGTLKAAGYNDKMYRWIVPAERLEKVRKDLESSGLVLSSMQAPVLRLV